MIDLEVKKITYLVDFLGFQRTLSRVYSLLLVNNNNYSILVFKGALIFKNFLTFLYKSYYSSVYFYNQFIIYYFNFKNKKFKNFYQSLYKNLMFIGFFHIKMTVLQPFFTFFNNTYNLKFWFSAGKILKLNLLGAKHLRRVVSKYQLLIDFFKECYFDLFSSFGIKPIIVGYLKRYSFFLISALFPFLKKYCKQLVFLTKVSLNKYHYKKHSPIKKRRYKQLK